MNLPDQFQTTDNLTRVANEANAWIAHLNVLASSLEGKARGYLELARTLPASPQKDQLVRSLELDVKATEDLRNRGPVCIR